MEIIEISQIFRFFAALVFVLALMGGLALILRRIHHKSPLTLNNKRLKIIETLALDNRRRLAIIKCDNQQHLIMLGANSETVIETNIESPQDVTHHDKDNEKSSHKKAA